MSGLAGIGRKLPFFSRLFVVLTEKLRFVDCTALSFDDSKMAGKLSCFKLKRNLISMRQSMKENIINA